MLHGQLPPTDTCRVGALFPPQLELKEVSSLLQPRLRTLGPCSLGINDSLVERPLFLYYHMPVVDTHLENRSFGAPVW